MSMKSIVATKNSWLAMKQRCDYKSHAAYKEYGGRGISYNPEWKEFKNFVRDMGYRTASQTLDRIDNSKGYYKENCRWATYQEQAYNRSNCRNREQEKKGLNGILYDEQKRIFAVARARNPIVVTNDFFEACCIRKSWENTW